MLLTYAWAANGLLAWLYIRYALDFGAPEGGFFDTTGLPIGRDFVVFWASSVLTAEGRLLEIYDVSMFRELGAELIGGEFPSYAWVHPPPMLFVVQPLAQLPYQLALAAWSAATLGAYLLATRGPHRLHLLFAPATFINLTIGQAGFLVGALHLGALRLLGRRPALAGVLVGLAAIKPHLGLMMPIALLALRAWRTILVALGVISAMVVGSGVVFGWETWRLWLVEALPGQVGAMHTGIGPGVTVSAFSAAIFAGAPGWAAWLVQMPFTALATVATWWAFSRLRRKRLAPASAHAVLLIATSIASPYMFVYDLTLLAPVVLYGLAGWCRRDWMQTGLRLRDLPEGLLWCGVWLLPVMVALEAGATGAAAGSLLLAAALATAAWRGRIAGSASHPSPGAI